MMCRLFVEEGSPLKTGLSLCKLVDGAPVGGGQCPWAGLCSWVRDGGMGDPRQCAHLLRELESRGVDSIKEIAIIAGEPETAQLLSVLPRAIAFFEFLRVSASGKGIPRSPGDLDPATWVRPGEGEGEGKGKGGAFDVEEEGEEEEADDAGSIASRLAELRLSAYLTSSKTDRATPPRPKPRSRPPPHADVDTDAVRVG
jgi:hypothetical protein